MNYILYDSTYRNQLLPFTFTRPVADIRIGILTIREKWEYHLASVTTTLTEDYLEGKYPMIEMDENIMINASFLPTQGIAEQIKTLKENQVIVQGKEILAFHTRKEQEVVDFDEYTLIECEDEFIQIKNTWDIFFYNGVALQADFDLITYGRDSEPIPETVQYINKDNIFIEKGAVINFATLNATKGPIYLGENSEVMEGALIRGSFALCEGSTIKMGAKIYGDTTVGPQCKVGGEVSNTVFFGFANKGHDGFLGNSVIGEWCNLGADTNNSNLKNNYAEVKLWSYETERFAKTGLQFCGLMMGDHSKCGINTMFNTGTVIGVSANVFGGNFPRNFIPSFSWGGNAGFTTYDMRKVNEVAKVVMKRRNIEYDDTEQKILNHVFETTSKYRRF